MYKRQPLVLSRTGWSGELGYELILQDAQRGTELWDLCMAAGAEFNIKPACPSLARSMEGGLLSYCSDITIADNPFTIGMDRLLDIDKPYDYIGKAALQKIAKEGTPLKLVGANFMGEPVRPNDHMLPVSAAGHIAGHLTRCVYSPRLEHNIALVNLPTEYAKPGTAIELHLPEGMRQAEVVALPWFTAEKKIPTW